MSIKTSLVRATAAGCKYLIVIIIGFLGYDTIVVDYGIIFAYSGLLSLVIGADLYYYFFKIRENTNEISSLHVYYLIIMSFVVLMPFSIVKNNLPLGIFPIFILTEVMCIEFQRYLNVIKGTIFSAYFILLRSILPLISVLFLAYFLSLTTTTLILALIITNAAVLIYFKTGDIKFTKSSYLPSVTDLFSALKFSFVYFLGSITSRIILLGDRILIDFIDPSDTDLLNYINSVILVSIIGISFEISLGQFMFRSIFKDANQKLSIKKFKNLIRSYLLFCSVILTLCFPSYLIIGMTGYKLTSFTIFALLLLVQLMVIGLGITQQVLYRLSGSGRCLVMRSNQYLVSLILVCLLLFVFHAKIMILLASMVFISLAAVLLRFFYAFNLVKELRIEV